jgi:hypothetical protein
VTVRELFGRADIDDGGDGTHVYILGGTPGCAQHVAVEKVFVSLA